MNVEHPLKAIIVAYANGRTIQRKDADVGLWVDVIYPNFDSSIEYRIKPEIIDIPVHFEVSLNDENNVKFTGLTWSFTLNPNFIIRYDSEFNKILEILPC